ncbi:MAG: hypothetical protein RSA55_06190, partial [Clostridia bacterium]
MPIPQEGEHREVWADTIYGVPTGNGVSVRGANPHGWAERHDARKACACRAMHPRQSAAPKGGDSNVKQKPC